MINPIKSSEIICFRQYLPFFVKSFVLFLWKSDLSWPLHCESYGQRRGGEDLESPKVWNSIFFTVVIKTEKQTIFVLKTLFKS